MEKKVSRWSFGKVKDTILLIIMSICAIGGTGLIVFVVFFTIHVLDNLSFNCGLILLGFSIAVVPTFVLSMIVETEITHKKTNGELK